MAKDADSEQMLQLVNTLLSQVQNISTGTRMMQQATGNFNHLATMPVNVASIYSSQLQRLGSQFLGPFGGMIGALAGKAIFGTGYDPKTGQPTSRFMDPVGLTLTGFQYNVAASQNQAYLNIAADAMFQDSKQQDMIKKLYSSMLGIQAPGTRTIVDFMFDPLQKRTMAASTNAMMTSVAQAMLTDPGKILSADQRKALGDFRDEMTKFGFKTQMGLEYNGGFNAGATLTLASAIASQDTSIKAGLSDANDKKVEYTGKLLRQRTKQLSDALSPLRDVFGNQMPILLAKLQQITGQGMTSMSASKLKQLTKHLHGTMAATNVGLQQLGQQQALVQQASAAMGNTIQGAQAMHVAMLNVQGVTGNAGFLGSHQKFQQYVTKTTVGAANSYNANIIAGALNILTARGGQQAQTWVDQLRNLAANGEIDKAMGILKDAGISQWQAQRAAGWQADPTARRYGTLMAINAGGKDIDADMQAAFNGYKFKNPAPNLTWKQFSDALEKGIQEGKSGNQLLLYIDENTDMSLQDVYRFTQLQPVKTGITSKAHRYNLQKQQEKQRADLERQKSAQIFQKTFVTPRSAGGLLGGMYTKDSKLRIAIYDKEGEVVGHATQEQLSKGQSGTYTTLDGHTQALDKNTHRTWGSQGKLVAADKDAIINTLSLKSTAKNNTYDYIDTFKSLSGRHQRALALMGVQQRNAYLNVIYNGNKDKATDADKQAKTQKIQQLDNKSVETQFGIKLQQGQNATDLYNRLDNYTDKQSQEDLRAQIAAEVQKRQYGTANQETIRKNQYRIKRIRVANNTASKQQRAQVASTQRLALLAEKRNKGRDELADLLKLDTGLTTWTQGLSTADFIDYAQKTMYKKDAKYTDKQKEAIKSKIEQVKKDAQLVTSVQNMKGTVGGNINNIGKQVLGVLKQLAEKLIQILGLQESKSK